ncbi:hypothetical protein Tco_0481656 [Tanacetum coccineum]
MTAPSSSSTNDANTASSQVSSASPSIILARLRANHKDDLEVIDLKWQLSLLSVRAKKYYQRTSKKIFINGNDIAGYDKSKVECYNIVHKLGHFARECRAPRSKEGQFKNQDNTRKQGNNEDTSKVIMAIDGVGFDWSDMAEEQVQTNMALMVFSDSEIKKNSSNNSKENSDKSLVEEQVSQVKSSSVEGCESNTSKSVSELEPKKVKKNNDALIIEDWVSDDEEQDESMTKPENKMVIPTVAKIEKPVKKLVRYAEM